MEAALHEQEMRVERMINVYRLLVYLASAGMDMLMFYQQGRLRESLPFVLILLPLAGGYLYLIDRLASGDTYRPWLKYATSTLDYVVIAGVVLEYGRRGIWEETFSPETWGAVLISVIVVYNFLGAFRYSLGAVMYNGALALSMAVGSGLLLARSPTLAVTGAAIVGVATLLSYGFSQNFKRMFERLRRRDALTRFLAPEVVERIMEGGIALEPGGEARQVTVLLCDIRGFTTIAEEMTPTSLVEWLNAYLSRITDVVFQYEGTLDKFIGDAVLAVFGAPVSQGDDARRAWRAARKMVAAVGALNEELEQQGQPRLRIGIALHTGVVVAGNVGSERQMEYTVIGDTVNLTARIEALNKEYDTVLLMSEDTYRHVRDASESALIAETRVRGRKKPVKLYGLQRRA
jgi:class 3 adenylate cyclase